MNKSSWIDILPPVTPAENISILVIAGSLAVLLLSIIIFLWHNSVKRRSARKLGNLSHNLPQTSHDKDIPFQISDILKQCFNVINVDHIVMPDQENWNSFKDKLVKACYRKGVLSQQELENLLLESRFWVKQRVKKND